MKSVALGEVAKLDRKSIAPPDIKAGTKYVGLEHISGDTGAIAEATVLNGEIKSSKFAFTPDHVLFGKLRPNLRKTTQATFWGICSTDIIPILPGPKLNARYLMHFLRTDEAVREATNKATGVNLPRLSPKLLADFEIPLPPLAEQKRIAAILDQADALRRLRRQSIDRLSTLAESYFTQMFGACIEKLDQGIGDFNLGDIAEVASGITKGRKLPGERMREVPYLAVANVQDKALNLSSVKTIQATEAEIERYRLQNGDLLLTEGGDPDKLGRGTLWRDEIEECIHQNHIFRVRVIDERFEPIYLNWLLANPSGKRYFFRLAKQTTGIASINKTQLKNFPLVSPPLDRQRQFASYIELLKSYQNSVTKHQSSLSALFSSLQRRAFRGEL